MAEQTTSSIVIAADPAAVMEVIADFEAYPEWAQGMKQAEVVERGPDGRAQHVYFELDASPIKDSYTLGLRLARRPRGAPGTWSRARCSRPGRHLRARRVGRRRTEVTYRLAVDVAIPMIGMLKRKAEKVIIDTALKGLKKRVESLG